MRENNLRRERKRGRNEELEKNWRKKNADLMDILPVSNNFIHALFHKNYTYAILKISGNSRIIQSYWPQWKTESVACILYENNRNSCIIVFADWQNQAIPTVIKTWSFKEFIYFSLCMYVCVHIACHINRDAGLLFIGRWWCVVAVQADFSSQAIALFGKDSV